MSLTRRLSSACCAVLLGAGLLGPQAASATPSAAAASVTAGVSAPVPTRHSAQARPYLVLGDSISAGHQPGRGDARTGGYAARVAQGMARRGTPVRITNLSCTGESTATMRRGGRCHYRQGSQQKAALAFLRAHRDTALITVSLGANDLLRCGNPRSGTVDAGCTQRRLDTLRPRLARTLTELRRSAPRARVVVLDYYDPFQAAYLLGNRARFAGDLAGILRSQANSAVRGAARDAGARVAYVSGSFDDGWARRAPLRGYGRVPVRVARICTWTWMCSSRRDIHPNDQGYRVIGDAVLRSIRRG